MTSNLFAIRIIEFDTDFTMFLSATGSFIYVNNIKDMWKYPTHRIAHQTDEINETLTEYQGYNSVVNSRVNSL